MEENIEKISEAAASRVPVPSNLALAILTTVFCCLPFGLISVIYACKTDAAASRGDFEKAFKYSDTAHKWVIWGIILGVIYISAIIITNICQAVFKLNNI